MIHPIKTSPLWRSIHLPVEDGKWGNMEGTCPDGVRCRSSKPPTNSCKDITETTRKENGCNGHCSFLAKPWAELFDKLSNGLMDYNHVEMMKGMDHKYSRWKDLAWRFINGLMGTFFLIAALLQINDPDSAVWIMLYLIPTIICFNVAICPTIQEFWQFKALSLFHTAVCLVGIVYTIYSGSGEIVKHRGNIFGAEEAREAGGLAIAVAWLFITVLIDSQRVQIMRPINWFKVITVALIPFITASIWFITVDFRNVAPHCRGIVKGN
eukprot:Seg1839.1 transcript_id=Seg1839.1/GoldUCD/mRNA.D3Y31 product="Transmembrane protein 220" protein_id=Seg1839.1/GoldUCD/D3Y31